jgi:tetrahydromethanopterin S-methyltransferase subunit G
MNQQTPAPDELHDLRKRMQKLEGRMTVANSRVQALGRQVRISRGFGGVGLVVSLLVIALTSLAAAPQRRGDAPAVERHQFMAPFEVLDDQENLILKISADGPIHWLGLYPAGTSPKDADRSKAALYASISQEGTVFRALTPGSVNGTVAFGIDGGTPGLALRYGGDSVRRLAMAVPNGAPDLNLMDATGRVLVDLGSGESGGDIGPGESGGGRLMLTNGAGGTIMQAGTTATGVGTVTVWPQGRGGFLPTAPIAGGAFALKEANRLPGTFICGVGCAGH